MKHIRGHLWTRILRNGLPSHGVRDRQTFEVMTSISLLGTFGSVTSLLAAALYPGNHARNHTLWNIGSTERNILHIYKDNRCVLSTLIISDWTLISGLVYSY